MGKTAAIVISWLYKRTGNDSATPRRLVYCLPMRVLVEQTAREARRWIENLKTSGLMPPASAPEVHVLMGGDTDREWDVGPEKDAILVGTQDQLLSRALNRGYGMSRFRWPVHFGLLNNDCLWVFDEVQLMGSGLATSAQMHAFRNRLGTALPTHSIWMSATLNKDWLCTVDFDPSRELADEISLSAEDRKSAALLRRLEAKKPLLKAPCTSGEPGVLARFVLGKHKPASRTLVVMNTVKKAVELYEHISRQNPSADLVLLHSRYRPKDRACMLDRLLTAPSGNGTICISTQVVEAGVDVSAATLITELAPWSSLVQRFGRCNREGLDEGASIFWVGFDLSKKGSAAPYEIKELENSLALLSGLSDAAPKNLPPSDEPFQYKHLLRRKDLLDLFDTTPDLAGADIDISRFIRENEDHDVQVFWRDLPKAGPDVGEPGPSRDELCSVPVGDIRNIKSLEAWKWDLLDRKWNKVNHFVPGFVLMLRREIGGYSKEKGWTGESKDLPAPLSMTGSVEEANEDDPKATGIWKPLIGHNDEVVQELTAILSQLPLAVPAWKEALLCAARWHDCGKSHPVFQKAMVGEPPEADPNIFWAKSERKGVLYGRRGFRHELASALALLQLGYPDLAVYLVAAHHGKVRLSIRSLPSESKPPDSKARFARGIWDGDLLPEAELGGGVNMPKTSLELSCAELGDGPHGPSWLSRMLSLRDDPALGPFRLGFLEAVFRASDWRASGGATK